MADPNWVIDTSVWMPIDSLATSYGGPVVFADAEQRVQWFSQKASNRTAVDHPEHQREDDGLTFKYEDGKPVMKTSKVKPAFWAPARIID